MEANMPPPPKERLRRARGRVLLGVPKSVLTPSDEDEAPLAATALSDLTDIDPALGVTDSESIDRSAGAFPDPGGESPRSVVGYLEGAFAGDARPSTSLPLHVGRERLVGNARWPCDFDALKDRSTPSEVTCGGPGASVIKGLFCALVAPRPIPTGLAAGVESSYVAGDGGKCASPDMMDDA